MTMEENLIRHIAEVISEIPCTVCPCCDSEHEARCQDMYAAEARKVFERIVKPLMETIAELEAENVWLSRRQARTPEQEA